MASELAICWLMAPAPFWSPQRLGGNSLGIVVSKARFKPGPLLRMEVNTRKLGESAKTKVTVMWVCLKMGVYGKLLAF